MSGNLNVAVITVTCKGVYLVCLGRKSGAHMHPLEKMTKPFASQMTSNYLLLLSKVINIYRYFLLKTFRVIEKRTNF